MNKYTKKRRFNSKKKSFKRKIETNRTHSIFDTQFGMLHGWLFEKNINPSELYSSCKLFELGLEVDDANELQSEKSNFIGLLVRWLVFGFNEELIQQKIAEEELLSYVINVHSRLQTNEQTLFVEFLGLTCDVLLIPELNDEIQSVIKASNQLTHNH